MNKLIIVCGPAGSGKSTLAKKLGKDSGFPFVILSTDDVVTTNLYDIEYHSPTDYESLEVKDLYLWSPEMIKESHHVNKIKCKIAMQKKVPIIIIDNTNLTFDEIKPYAKLAIENGYEIELNFPMTEWKCDVDELFKRNKHNVPRNVLENQVKKYRDLHIGELFSKINALKGEV